jgi:gliding motility-associated-like protein
MLKNRIYSFITVLCCVCMLATSFAQQQKMPLPNAPVNDLFSQVQPCATDILLQDLRKNEHYRQREEKMNKEIAAFRLLDDNTVYTLPVVVHIVGMSPYLVSDAQINAALQDLNDAFGKSGSYAGSDGADTRIQFCLAKLDPDGGITNGITRTTSYFAVHSNTYIEDSRLKNLVQWDPSHYINIWYIANMHYEIMPKFQCGTWLRMNAGGYATMPPGGGSTDGIVVTAFGGMLAHEMGHYLGLYHTFEGLNCQNNDCTIDGDKVCDTPPEVSLTSSCSSPTNSCFTDTLSGFTTDQMDRMKNFMDYGNSSCANEFTDGQAKRMRAAITTQRSGLLVDKCAPACTETIAAGFIRNKPYPLPGDVINFTNTTSGATSYEWLVNDVVVASTANYTHSFSIAGKYKVTLKAYNGTTCFGSYTDFLIVTCGTTARFYTDKREIASKEGIELDSIRFTNTSENATSYRWLMSSSAGMPEQQISTAANFTYVFQTPGTYLVRLIATNGTCSDTTQSFVIPVNDPTADGSLYISNAECYQQTKVRLTFYVCNFGFNKIPAGTPVSFYDADPRAAGANKLGTTFYLPADIPGNCCGYLLSHIVDVGYKGLNTVYGVLADSGKVYPVSLPNTSLVEKSYLNNIWSFRNFAYKVTAIPSSATMDWGDTLKLDAKAGPGFSSYTWSTAANLSCTNCQSPLFVADTNSTKRVVATSSLGCTDTAYVPVLVPPYNDFSVTLNDVQCYKKDSLRITLTIENKFKRGIIPKGITVAFYNNNPAFNTAVALPLYTIADTVKAKTFTTSIAVKNPATGQLYSVVNDSAKGLPVTLPNTPFFERDYSNNTSSINVNGFSVTVDPVAASLEWGDTLQLAATAKPSVSVNYLWTDPTNISCTNCSFTELIARTDIIKKVVAQNPYGCTDTAVVTIKVPPYNDFSAVINEAFCSRNDSIHLKFTISNSFKRGVLPKTLTVSFYKGNPASDTAILLKPSFSLADSVFAKTASYEHVIKGYPSGDLYISINDSAKAIPVLYPNTVLLEKSYVNNQSNIFYKPDTIIVSPADTTVLRKEFVPLSIGSTIYNAASTRWQTGTTYDLSCTNCLAAAASPYNQSIINVQTENKYGCLVNGKSIIKIFPPDMQVKILETQCYTNSTARVRFSICMNNAYDSVFANIPVAFYDGDPSNGRLLTPVFKTPRIQAGQCYTYTTTVKAPFVTRQFVAVVNDKATDRTTIPLPAFNETGFDNNGDTAVYTPFSVHLYPQDTVIERLTSLPLLSSGEGGTITKYWWTPGQFLSCNSCATPVVTPDYTKQYSLVAQNEYACTDTAIALIRTHTGSGVRIPNAFTPNTDGKNDIFYVMTGPDVKLIKNFAVYNRWGNKVFEVQQCLPNDPRFGWNGKQNGQDAPSAAYVYYVTLTLVDGKEQTVKGTIVLVR